MTLPHNAEHARPVRMLLTADDGVTIEHDVSGIEIHRDGLVLSWPTGTMVIGPRGFTITPSRRTRP